MGKIDELIKQFCPDGVKKVPLGDVLDYEQPSKYIVKSTEYDNSYNIPVLTAGKGFLLGYTNEQTGVYAASEENPTIIFDDFVTSFHWVDFPFKVKSSAMKMLTCKDKVNSFRFIYYAMCEIGFVAKEHSRHWISVYSKIEIPLPPLAVQKEIVEILDTFTGMIDNLQKELEQRQKQFDYYRDNLFMFKSNIKYKELGKLCLIKGRIGFRGYTKNDFVEFKKGAISLSPGDIKDNQLHFDNCSYISWDKYEQSPEIVVECGDILLCKTGSTVGKTAIVQELPWKATINPQFVILKNVELNNKYLFYALCLPCTQIEIKRLAGVGSVPNVSQAKLAKVKIPIPSLDKQQEIVDKLDTFEALISNIKQEIELRQKQYEYYREKLLTFE